MRTCHRVPFQRQRDLLRALGQLNWQQFARQHLATRIFEIIAGPERSDAIVVQTFGQTL